MRLRVSAAPRPGRRLRLGLVVSVAIAGLVVWGAGFASATSPKATATPAVGAPASGNPKVGHLGTPVSRARTTKAHRFVRVSPYGVLRHYSIQSSSVAVLNGTQQGTTATCPVGTVVMGGGAYTAAVSLGANVNSSYPMSDGSGWTAFESNVTGGTDTLTAYAICAKKPAYYGVVEGGPVDNPAGTQTAAAVACPPKYKVLGVGAALSSFDTAVNLNGLIPYKAIRPTTFGTSVWGNNAGVGGDTIYPFAVCGKIKGWSMTASAPVVNPAGAETFVSQACPAGAIPTGGGVFASSGSTAANVNSTYPNPGFTGWGAYENNGSGFDESITAWAVCAL